MYADNKITWWNRKEHLIGIWLSGFLVIKNIVCTESSVADPGRFGLDPEPTFCCDADKKDLIFMVFFGIKFILSSFLGLGWKTVIHVYQNFSNEQRGFHFGSGSGSATLLERIYNAKAIYLGLGHSLAPWQNYLFYKFSHFYLSSWWWVCEDVSAPPLSQGPAGASTRGAGQLWLLFLL